MFTVSNTNSSVIQNSQSLVSLQNMDLPHCDAELGRPKFELTKDWVSGRCIGDTRSVIVCHE